VGFTRQPEQAHSSTLQELTPAGTSKGSRANASASPPRRWRIQQTAQASLSFAQQVTHYLRVQRIKIEPITPGSILSHKIS